jgi:hypothetical protein
MGTIPSERAGYRLRRRSHEGPPHGTRIPGTRSPHDRRLREWHATDWPAGGRAVEAAASFTIDDLPYDFWGVPPEAVTVTAEGEPLAMGLGSTWDVSADGRFIVFDTDAPALPELDSNGAFDVYVKDMETGELRLVSAAEDGSAASGEGPVVISGEGRYVTFYSRATNLGVDTGDDPWAWHYYRAENPLWEPLD